MRKPGLIPASIYQRVFQIAMGAQQGNALIAHTRPLSAILQSDPAFGKCFRT